MNMSSKYIVSRICIAFLFTLSCSAYVLDPTCPGWVESAVTNAFSMASDAQKRLEAISNGQTVDQDVVDLNSYMFGNAAPAGTSARFKAASTGLLTQSRGTTAQMRADPLDVVIFCSTSQYQALSAQQALSVGFDDPDDHRFHSYYNAIMPWDGALRACATRGASNGNLMVTQRMQNRALGAFIQVCPDYIAAQAAATYKTTLDIGDWKGFAITSSANAFRLGGAGKKAVDALNLGDVVMLHELFHTRATIPPGQTDVIYDINGADSYFWENCKALATAGRGALNADNYARFGLGVRLIKNAIFV